MERLTERSANSNMVWFKDCENDNALLEPCEMTVHHNRMVIEKLSTYESLEEQGRLIKLSCKVGDTIWYVNEDDDEYPIELEIDTILREDNKDTWYCVNDDVYGKFEFIDSDFGETVFLTESEAEARLKELRGNNE